MITNYTKHEQDKLIEMGFYWHELCKEWFSDQEENEMAIFRDYDMHFVLRTRRWDDDLCEFEDDYEHFDNFDEVVAFLK